MNENQTEAVKKHTLELSKRLNPSVELFLYYLKCKMVISADEIEVIRKATIKTAIVVELFELLQTKDHGWPVTIEFLNVNDYKSLANTLKASAGERVERNFFLFNRLSFLPASLSGDFKRSFKSILVKYYKNGYSRISTMFGCHKHVKDIWVPLMFDDKTLNPNQQDRIDHSVLLKRLWESESSNVALVIGHPGSGKTTVLKKITHDWAVGNVGQFSLVMVVSLRYAESSVDILQLTTDYYANQFGLSPRNKAKLLNWLIKLGSGLLICLDGLDEYDSIDASPLKTLFTVPFESSGRTSTVSIPFLFPYKIIITSRPYVCNFQAAIPDFFPLKFEMSAIDENALAKFAENYGEKPSVVKKVKKYLDENSDSLIRVPLILTFLCFLADVAEELPTNLTLLYERLLRHLVNREIEKGKLKEKIRIDNWKESEVAKVTAKLAYEGCRKGKFEFSPSTQEEFGVTKDSFACGFLLHKFDYGKESPIGEFPHASVQTFFAALHCCHLISQKKSKTQRDYVMKEILNKNSQFGRFFLGIWEDRKKFAEMLEWLNPTFEDLKIIEQNSFDFSRFLRILSAKLSDCSEAKLFGQRLVTSFGQIQSQIMMERNYEVRLRSPSIRTLSESFQSGLNLSYPEGNCWSLSYANNPKCSRFMRVRGMPPVDLRQKIDIIEVCMWQWDIDETLEMIAQFDRLPPISVLIIQTDYSGSSEVNLSLKYEKTARASANVEMRQFTLGVKDSQIGKLNEKFWRELDPNNLILGVPKSKSGEVQISLMPVTVRSYLDRELLLESLIRLGLEIANTTPNLKKQRKRESLTKCGVQ